MKFFKYPLLAVIIIQAIFCVIAFNKFFGNPNNYMFQETYDGFKNYMTFQTYLSQPNKDITKYTQMNYPYGEYIFYTDNSPLISVPLKLFSNHIVDISAYSVMIYNGIIIFGYFIAAVLLFLILKRFIKNKFLLIIFSLAFTWIHPQMLRPFIGHHNLGLACVLLLTVLGTLKLQEATSKRKEWKWLILLTITLISSGFIHLYYLLINGFFIGFWGLAWAIDNFIQKKNWLSILIKTWSVTLTGILTCFLTIRFIDSEYANRGEAGGYNWSLWSLKIKGIFSSYDFNTIQPLRSVEVLSPENYAYLGAATIFTLLGILILFLLKKGFLIKPHLKIFTFSENRILIYWLFAGVMMAFIALGSTIQTENFIISNYLSLLFYGDLVSDKFSQFRCLGRFSWFLFWSVNICFALLLSNILEKSKHKFSKYLVIGLLIVLFVDATDFVRRLNGIHRPNQFVEKIVIGEYENLAKAIDAKKYQAILPLPFFHTGTEVSELTIDAPFNWLNSMGKLSYLTDLPLMASQLSRTPPYQAEELYSIFRADKLNANLLSKLNKKPVLVVYSKYFNNPELSNWYTNSEATKEIALNGGDIIEKYKMTLIHETNNYKLYRWDL